MFYTDRSAENDKVYTYVVAGANRQHQEGRYSQSRSVKKLEKKVKKVNAKTLRVEKKKRSKKEKEEDEGTPDFRTAY